MQSLNSFGRIAVVLAVAAFCAHAVAQAYPSKWIRFVVPFPAG